MYGIVYPNQMGPNGHKRARWAQWAQWAQRAQMGLTGAMGPTGGRTDGRTAPWMDALYLTGRPHHLPYQTICCLYVFPQLLSGPAGPSQYFLAAVPTPRQKTKCAGWKYVTLPLDQFI